MRLNNGTLLTETEGGLELPVGLSIGGREGFLSIIGGSEPLVFSGTTSFFRGTNTSGELRLDVINDTTFNGPFAATGGGGTASGITIGGSGSLTVNGASVTFADFGISDLFGFSAAVPDGSYTLIDGSATINTANLRNLGPGNPFDLGGGRRAYFETGSLVLQVVPEPSAVILAGLGIAAAALGLKRRLRKGA